MNPKTNSNQLAIIIVCTNELHHMKDCLKSIFHSTFRDFHIIVTDNNSQDGSKEFIKKNYPEVYIIESRNNNGYARGNNMGVKKALEQKFENILLLNPDTIMDKDCLKELMAASDGNTVLQPMIYLYRDGCKTDIINTTGNYLNFLGISYCNDYKTKKEINAPITIATASGAALFAPAKILKKIGLIDEDFFMYHEDLDLGWRARLAGFETKLIPSAVLWHKYTFKKKVNKLMFIERNKFLFLYKNFSARYLIVILPAVLLNEFFTFFYFFFKGQIAYKIRSYFEVMKSLPKGRNKRAQIQKQRRVADSELVQFIGGKLDFREYNFFLLKIYSKLLNAYWSIAKHLV